MKQIKLLLLSLVFVNSLLANYYGIKLSDTEKVTALTNSLVKEEMKVTKPTFPNKPKKPLIPKAERITKGKYEKLKTFEARVENEKIQRLKKIKVLEKRYADKVKIYNDKVKILTDNYNNALALKQKNIKNITLEAVKKAYFKVYGTPYLASGLKYDAEAEIFYGKVKSTKGSFSENVAIPVPINIAENFDRNVKNLKTKIIFSYEDNKLTVKKILIEKPNQTKPFIAMLSDDNYKSETISVALKNGSLNLPATPLLSSSLALNDSSYAIGEINYSKDPVIAKLQMKKFKLEREARERKQTKLRKEKMLKQREALESQIVLLEQKSGGVDDIESLLKNAKTHKIDSKKWLFIVAIENYEYTNPVAYSAQSAKDFKKVMKKRLGIPEKNIRTLINKGATSGKIRYKLKDMLAHVKNGDTIYFYYSGHGIPVPSQNNTPYLLAQDMSPDYVSDDERFKLQNIYKSLSSSKASKIIAFVDSCFSGGTDNQSLIKGVAGSRLVPKHIRFNEHKMLVISAGSGLQYSNKYDDKSNRLFSYFVMRGVIKNNSNTQRLYDYVKSNVQEKSYEMGQSYEQVPVFSGNIGMKL